MHTTLQALLKAPFFLPHCNINNSSTPFFFPNLFCCYLVSSSSYSFSTSQLKIQFSDAMDLEEWEFLSDDGLIDQLETQDVSLKRAISRETLALYPDGTIDMDYFQKFIDPRTKKNKMDPREVIPPSLVIPVPVEFDLRTLESPKPSLPDVSVVKEVIQGDKETVSPQVFFKQMGENEFADMKLDSPKSTKRGLSPQIDLGKPQFEEEEVGFDGADDGWKSPKEGFFVKADEGVFDCKEKFTDPDQKDWENGSNQGGLNIWKMGMTGVGALCSFGFACATICVIALGYRHRERPQDQKLRFQIYADDKRIKQMVHHAAKLNEAISAVRGAPVSSRAHITIGGYFEGL